MLKLLPVVNAVALSGGITVKYCEVVIIFHWNKITQLISILSNHKILAN